MSAEGQAAGCGSTIDTGQFPGTLIIDIRRGQIGIGSVAPFEGGTGRIVATAGVLQDGVASLRATAGDFAFDTFEFPYLLSWSTRLEAQSAGLGFAVVKPGERTASLWLDVRLEARNILGAVRFDAAFTSGTSGPVTIDGVDYAPAGTPLDLDTGKAVIVASGKTSPDSNLLFRHNDYYARAGVCVYFRESAGE